MPIVVRQLHSKPCTLIKPFLLLCSDFIQICSQFFCSDGEQFENDSALDSDSEHVPHVFGHIFSILVLPIKSTFDESKQNSLNLSHWLLGFSLLSYNRGGVSENVPPRILTFCKTSLSESLQPSDETNAGAARKSHFVITIYFSVV